MTELPLQALMKAVTNKLNGAGIWNNRVSEVIQPSWVKPYCQVYWVSGGEANRLREQDAEIELGVKVIATSQADSFNGAAQVLALLNDMGDQDVTSGALDGGTDWTITTSTAGRMIHIVEPFSGVENIYHDGNVYSFVMGRNAY